MSIDKRDIIDYFDEHAASWDSETVKDDGIVSFILDNAGVSKGKNILDVATGTGVLIPDYYSRSVSSVTAIDISPEMIRICRGKYPDIDAICADAENYDFGRLFDCIVIYNAFPHFPEPEKLISHLEPFLSKDGTLTIAHGMSRRMIDSHHSGHARNVSVGLMDIDNLDKLLSAYLDVTYKISDDRMYQIVGKKRN